MINHSNYIYCLLMLVGGLAGCTLTANDVEPALPAVPVNQANTVVYHLNGKPVVAHNYADLATQIILPFLGPLGGGAPVSAALGADGVLTVRCVDDQNITRPGLIQHRLGWQLGQFRGVGTYAPLPTTAGLQLLIRDAADEAWEAGPVQRLAALGPAEVVVTDWNPATRHLRGTLTLTFAATGNAPVAEVRDGQFDLLLAP